MPEIELKTAKFFEQQNERQIETGGMNVGDSDAPGLTPAAPSKTAAWEKVAAWMGVGAAGLVVVCLTLIAVPMVTGIKLPKSASPIDWWLWFGGAKSDQTFEKFVKDTAKKNPLDLEEKDRQSPAYQFQGMEPIHLNPMQGMQFKGFPANTPSQQRVREAASGCDVYVC